MPTDCVGNALTSVTATLVVTNPAGTGTITSFIPYYVADNRFYLGTSTAITTPSLYCKGAGGAAQPLVRTSRTCKFTVWNDLRDGDVHGEHRGLPTAAEVVSEASLAALANDAARWSKVVSVRICVVARSENPVAPDLDPARSPQMRWGLWKPTHRTAA